MRSLLFSYSHSFSLWESSYCAPRNRKFIMMSNTTKFLLPMISNNLILTPPPLAISAATSSNYYHNKTSSPHHPGPVVPSTLQLNDKPLLMKRREAIFNIIGLGIVLVDVLLHPQPVAAAEATVSSSCELTVAPSGLAFCDKVVGSGPEAVKGQLIKAHYIGKLENGKVFDSSYNRGKPLIFRVGVGEVIKGWDQGILGGDGIPPMLAGGKRTLKLPPELGYGMRGAGCKGGSCIIPPDSVLLFDVDFIGKA
ncbi:peptidyl-prolyl cis-trans isomerase FKBP13, chloroplastic-like isoform X2 [Cornus florida]|uniref:peptidyl-prolyl cis-trans isomerase FKBP13, chloroplastic-like isoform X2 n=1 Tax=Cornus florida TaxID=4283 RepID=UPI002898CF50|nr:peptidyl-prolyl cis-trans isomerase FKBP13, chloroplastic-like isoform X2 [Cornus florida]